MAKKFKKLKKALKTAGRKVARVGGVAAPILGAAIGGPLGGLIGGAAGAGLTRVHQKDDSRGKRRARLKRSMLATGASVAASGAANLLLGGGLTSSPLTSAATKLFAGRTGTPSPLDGLQSSALGGDLMPFDSANMLGGQSMTAGITALSTPQPSLSWADQVARAGGSLLTNVTGPTQPASLPGAPVLDAVLGATNDGAVLPGAGANLLGGGVVEEEGGLFGGDNKVLLVIAAVVAVGLLMRRKG